VKNSAAIRDYAIEQMNRLLTNLAFQIHRTSKSSGPEEIHDFRVSIRRFSQGLQVFSSFLPKWQVKKIKRLLKELMQLTSEIRNRDITLEFLTEEDHDEYRRRLERERASYQRRFSSMVRRWSASDFSVKWRSGLALQPV